VPGMVLVIIGFIPHLLFYSIILFIIVINILIAISIKFCHRSTRIQI
jgi:hypothetical protein